MATTHGDMDVSSSTTAYWKGRELEEQVYRQDMYAQITPMDIQKTMHTPFDANYSTNYLDAPETPSNPLEDGKSAAFANPRPTETPLPPTVTSKGLFFETRCEHPVLFTDAAKKNLPFAKSAQDDWYQGPYAPLCEADAQELCVDPSSRLKIFEACPLSFCHRRDAQSGWFCDLLHSTKTSLPDAVWLFFSLPPQDEREEEAQKEQFCAEGFIPLLDYFSRARPPAFDAPPAFENALCGWYICPEKWESFPHDTTLAAVASADREGGSNPQTVAMVLYLLLFATLGEKEISLHPLATFHPKLGRIFIIPKSHDQLCRLWTCPVTFFEETSISFPGWPSKLFFDIDGVLHSDGSSTIQGGYLVPCEEGAPYLRGVDYNNYLIDVEEDVCEALERTLPKYLPWPDARFSLATTHDQSQVRVLAGHRFKPGSTRSNFSIKVSLHVIVSPRHPSTDALVLLANTLDHGRAISRAVSKYLIQEKGWLAAENKPSCAAALDEAIYNKTHCLRSVASPRIFAKDERLDICAAKTPMYPLATRGLDGLKEAWHNPEYWVSALSPSDLHRGLFYTIPPEECSSLSGAHTRTGESHLHSSHAHDDKNRPHGKPARTKKRHTAEARRANFQKEIQKWLDESSSRDQVPEPIKRDVEKYRDKIFQSCLHVYDAVCEENNGRFGFSFATKGPTGHMRMRFSECSDIPDTAASSCEGMYCSACGTGYTDVCIHVDEGGCAEKKCYRCNTTTQYDMEE